MAKIRIENHNNRRSSLLSFLSRKNGFLAKDLESWLKNNKPDKKTLDLLYKLIKNLKTCANHSLYRENSKIEYIASMTCDSRACFICNWQRQKKVRRKYLKFFNENKHIYCTLNIKNGKLKYFTKDHFLRLIPVDKNETRIKPSIYRKVPEGLQNKRTGKIYECSTVFIQRYCEQIPETNDFVILKNKSFLEVSGTENKKPGNSGEYWKNENGTYSKILGVYEFYSKRQYDLMHLVLTVPHPNGKYKDQEEYYSQIETDFKSLRRCVFWEEWVYGGEFGIETTKTVNGLHIHIHALLLVRKEKENRSQLHKEILISWNRITEHDSHENRSLNIEKIRKGNKLLSIPEAEKLRPKGATLITLEGIYSVKGGEKVRSSEWGSNEMIKAVLETIKYHFKPDLFHKQENGEFDIDLIAAILPKIYKRQLYQRIGCLCGVKYLNAKGDILEDFEETKNNEVDKDSLFYILSPRYIYHEIKTDGAPQISAFGRQIAKPIDAQNTPEAVEILKTGYSYIKKTGG